MRTIKHIIILLSISLGLASCGIMVPRHAYISKAVYVQIFCEKSITLLLKNLENVYICHR